MDRLVSIPPKEVFQNRQLVMRQMAENIGIGFPRSFDRSSNPVHDFHTNDAEIKSAWRKANRLLKEQKIEDDTIRIGLIVGTGAWQTILPELEPHIDMLLFVDNNPSMSEWVRYTQGALKQCQTREEYRRSVYEDLRSPWQDATFREYGMRRAEEDHMGDKHFLYSDANYEKSRNTYLQALASGKAMMPVYIDLADPIQLKRLGNTIGSRGKVTYANFTNVAEHIADVGMQDGNAVSMATTTYPASLRVLPFHDNVVVQYSKSTIRDGPVMLGITAKVATQLDDYFGNAA